ncbi:CocE/NonD family hydrolase [Lutispora saccharofermentans]|uniref:CocE/NonD family hydrolase n=1 Tax=Lutispora saccharofermentans TaxID=3024236 RepID=A0ABT1NJR8_9FIRM|nr:CocE/NonD family hydrolase [Lutispora saccharofermentans]MCQ1531515.1 CocE/NonD family hydrolase [Lutispora saccharofermentans]
MRKFALYQSGINYGFIYFNGDNVLHEKLNVFSNELEERKELTKEDHAFYNDFTKINLMLLNERLAAYEEIFTKAEGDKIETPFGEIYSKYNDIWVQRNKKFPLDIIVADNKIVGFNCPAREICTCLVEEGYELRTSLKVWNEKKKGEKLHPVKFLGEFMVEMRDGVKLSTNVFLPKGIDEKLPVILVRTPYGKEIFSQNHYKYVQRGYAVVIQDVRGRNESEGKWLPMYYEADDGNDTANWIAKQAWSNQKIGMIGGSYGGYVQWALASTGNPYLKAMVSIVTAGGPFTDMPRKGGAFTSGMLAWAFSVSRKKFMPELMARDDWDEVLNIRPLQDVVPKALGYPVEFIDQWLNRDDYDEYWEKTDWYSKKNNIKDIAILVLSGWYDDNGTGTTEALDVINSFDKEKRKAILGPWMHSGNSIRDLHGVAFGDNALRYDLDYSYLAWFDCHLKGIKNGINEGAPVEYYTVGSNQWKTSSNWPLPDTKYVDMYLQSFGNANSSYGDGRLNFNASKENKKDTYIYNPEDPAVQLIDVSENEVAVPGNYKDEEKRKDILCYTSEELEADLTITGDIIAEFYASSTAPDTDWVVKILDVDEEGNSIKLADGLLTAKYRNSFAKPEFMKADEVYNFIIRTSKISNTFKKGHKIRFTITSSAKNFIFPHSNTKKSFNSTKIVIAENTIYHGEKYPSKIILPIEG